MIHIGKTGGSNLKSTLENLKCKKYELIFHPHEVCLVDIPVGEKYFFCVRDPIDRFQSGFYSRKRKGQPRYYSEWSEFERISFNKFSTPEELASSLNTNKNNYEEAVLAMKSIIHLNSSYWDWFQNEEYFNKRLSDLFFILRLENLNEDFKSLIKKIGINNEIKLRTDVLSMHSNNERYYLSENSIKNLNEWYEKEYSFIKFINNKIQLVNKQV
jgi:hypothetical protein